MNARLPDQQYALPDRWVDALFDRMEAQWGSKVASLWGNTNLSNVKSLWSEKLSGFADNPKAFTYALNALEESPFPPTLPEFLALCRKAPRPVLEALPEPKADPVRVKQEINKAHDAVTGKKDDHGWAKRPSSQHALNLLIKWAREGDSQAKGYLKNLIEAGHVEGATLIHKWNLGQWVRA